MLNVLIGFEESQTVAKEFRKMGVTAYSNDIKDCTGNRPAIHLKMDFFKALKLAKWDLIILHPPCTFTSLSGNRWYYKSDLRKEGIELTRRAWNEARAVCDFVLLEQPKTILQKYIGVRSQIIHPWQFGDGETKETWLWLHNLPQLIPTNIVEGREQKIFLMPPGKDRSVLRSKTYEGIANAIATQYTNFLMDRI